MFSVDKSFALIFFKPDFSAKTDASFSLYKPLSIFSVAKSLYIFENFNIILYKTLNS